MLKHLLRVILFSFFAAGLFAGAAQDEGKQKESLVNEVLFSITGESFTSHDRNIYQSVLNEILQKNKISSFTKKTTDDFLLSRLSYQEAKAFELTGSAKIKLSESSRHKLSEFSPAEIEREIDVISRARALIEIKETQLKQQDRFDTWFQLLKRKYQFKPKSPDMK